MKKYRFHARMLLLLAAVLLMIISLRACLTRREYSPDHGHWETDDKSIVICCEDATHSYITRNGQRVSCHWENDRGSRVLLFSVISDSGKLLATGKTVSLNETEWVIELEGVKYRLRNRAENAGCK